MGVSVYFFLDEHIHTNVLVINEVELVSPTLRDPALVDESRAALDELTQILKLGSVYPFQQG